MKKSAIKVCGIYSTEKLAHFQCGLCKGWWGIGDAPSRAEWYCPWCGVKQTFSGKMPKIIHKGVDTKI